MSFTEVILRGLEPKTKRYMLADSHGLSIEVMPSGNKVWKMSYRYKGKQRKATLGHFPETKLKKAREMRDSAKLKLAKGVDPFRKASGKPVRTEAELLGPEPGATWREVCEEYLHKRKIEGAQAITVKKITHYLRKTWPAIGRKQVDTIIAADLLAVLREEEAKEHYESARRIRSYAGMVLRYAIGTQRAERNVAADLRDALITPKVKHRPGIVEAAQIGGLMRSIDGYGGHAQVRAALLIQAYCFLRPGETRKGEWDHVDFERRQWRIPASRMKGGRHDHIVPLSNQALKVLERLRPHTDDSRFIFAQLRSNERPLSENGMNVALLNIGIARDTHVPHGFRTTASTSLNEAGWNWDWIETQLAHVHRNAVRGAYNAAKYLKPRRVMMQAYADWLDALAAGEDLDASDLAPSGSV
ncbi:tyrosine-type recombinase/integrase [Candidatus Halocynthiibacter alkanivorans]|uniref:tyrosine-type recombinase/integrase n=1 Tax=Candidatus Halocynthiibacter alkanivorans TaxID=2267619 RepID=UPI00135BED2A|nr:tyrosine-type recombinase/integrase [Candidatus Halocynthiibacter alkanivorans]